MTKKDYITIFLDKVKEIWEPARWFSVLLRYDVLDEKQVDQLFLVFRDAVNNASNTQKKWKIQKAILAVENIRNQEKSSSMFESDLDKILFEE